MSHKIDIQNFHLWPDKTLSAFYILRIRFFAGSGSDSDPSFLGGLINTTSILT